MDAKKAQIVPTKPRIREAIVVEGRYDKNTLAQVVDAVIIETRGFGVFTDDELFALLRRLADTCGVIVLTDSDGAGFQIRNHIKSALGGAVKHAYIPEIEGKERRKRTASRAGTLGVEGMSADTLLRALRTAGATFDYASPPQFATPHAPQNAEISTHATEPSARMSDAEIAPQPRSEPLTKYDLYALGLSGTPDASQRRAALLQRLELPRLLSANALLDVLNALYTRAEITETLRTL